MPLIWLLAAIAVLAAAGMVLGRRRALASAGGDHRVLHSLPSYYGTNVALFAAAPALLVMAAWIVVQPLYVESRVATLIPQAEYSDEGELSLIMSDVRRVADGLNQAIRSGAISAEEVRDMRADVTDVRDRLAQIGIAVGSEVEQTTLTAAQQYRTLDGRGNVAMAVFVLLLAVGGFVWTLMKTDKDYRARNSVENAILTILVAASTVAILTTFGIIMSMLFETVNFFRQYPASEFFFSTTWDPSFSGRGGSSELGIIPLLWGTLYISLIALLVAVPIGLFSAIYLSEYAGKKFRSIAKPLLEVLAGIPTIVYGLFALITVGPLLRDAIASPLGLGTSASSVMTAGLVMGVMLIPFVSSLSDDIINAVPQAMRDGSLGLGATQSETIKQVVVPAALPGIVGAILLAASRAIGETMIVVLGAGAAARLDLNPFEAMTTVTVKIVSQLTGDTDFSSPETLVAFALGLTLFVITLGLNVLALYIVRKYREQYE
ncbi:phosphate ABC transporter permease subunit PstC [Jannaschia aquimarina]|uniref:Phosphate transport system permease protein n=1 Tax=Jannaschia aquimarina TaxID=935700 RepID=A0A0D1CN49_9RHOB|nr:phosphate ABC transporter permease subunit PstC [Jannaschia aquimarina]KIT16197.1 Phosphate transport system permease protein PstC [Jannaschia aquimarina]SNT39985.1 phosphate ABC transporter membrane protein 1, PhoT family [Jannaschia aquimarina]